MLVARALGTPLIIAAFSFCCFAAELVPPMLERDPVNIVGGYSLGRVRLGGLELYGTPYEPADGIGIAYPTVVEQEIVRIGWNRDFILMEQHPLGHTSRATPDASNAKWHIVDVTTGRTYRYLSYEDFLLMREKLGIPDAIEMRSAHEVYGE